MDRSKQMATSTVAEAIVGQLAAAGVRRVYGVIGDAVFPLADALGRQEDVQFIATAHEAHAAYMASYEAKLTRRPVACMATSGPGATNLATGVADAYFDGAPVLAVTGQVPTGKIGGGAKQFFDQQTFFRPITHSTTLAASPETALHAVLTGLNDAVLHATAVHVSIPKDVLAASVLWTPVAVPSAHPAPPPPWSANGAAPRPPLRVLGDPEEAFARLGGARRPLLVLGFTDGAAVQEALALAEAAGAAVVTAQQAKGAVPQDHPRLIGGIGEAHVPPLVAEADLLLLVGDAPYEGRFLPLGAPCIVVAPTHRGVPGRPLLAEFLGDVPGALAELGRRAADAAHDGRWQQAIRDAREAWEGQIVEMARRARDGDGAEGERGREERSNPYALAAALSEVVAEDAIVTVDVGAFSHWFDLGFRARKQTILSSPRWRGIGLSLPAAIAAKLAHPERQVVAVVGDGALLPALGELTTAVRYGLPILVVVPNNETYDIERQKMAVEGLGGTGTELPTPDFVAVARACGAAAFQVGRAAALQEVLVRGLGQTDPSANGAAAGDGRPVLIDVPTETPALPHLVGADGKT